MLNLNFGKNKKQKDEFLEAVAMFEAGEATVKDLIAPSAIKIGHLVLLKLLKFMHELCLLLLIHVIFILIGFLR